MSLPEIPDYLFWRVERRPWPELYIALVSKTDGRSVGGKELSVRDLRDEEKIVEQVELHAGYVYDTWSRKRELDQIIERNWPEQFCNIKDAKK